MELDYLSHRTATCGLHIHISRFARNTRDLLELVEQLAAKEVEFVSQKEAIDTATPTGKFMLTVFRAVAELEREGTEIAKAQGKYRGRKPISSPDFDKVAARWHSGRVPRCSGCEAAWHKQGTFSRKISHLTKDKKAV